MAVGYRVRSPRGTQFRRWATERLKEYLVKGFTMDDERLRNPPVEGSGVPDYFDELLERIRDIRASERRMYLRVKEIFALAADYDAAQKSTVEFFKIIQNKLHFAATGHTAAELIARRADHALPNMGLTTWKGETVRKQDVTVAKNYLSEEEIRELNRIVTMWLDFAEDQARRRKQVFLKDWETKLKEFLVFNERAVLSGAGSISKKDADGHAEAEYERFAARRRALLEAEGERTNLKALEDTAKKLPTRKRKPPPKSRIPRDRGCAMKLHFEAQPRLSALRDRGGLRPLPGPGDLPDRVHRHAEFRRRPGGPCRTCERPRYRQPAVVARRSRSSPTSTISSFATA